MIDGGDYWLGVEVLVLVSVAVWALSVVALAWALEVGNPGRNVSNSMMTE